MKLNYLVIYRASCLAGFTSAWIIHQNFRDGILDVPAAVIVVDPDLTNSNIRLVSYTYEIGEQVETITVGYMATTYSKDLQFLVDTGVVDKGTTVYMAGISMPPQKAESFAEGVSILRILDSSVDTAEDYEGYFGNHAPLFGQNDPGNIILDTDADMQSSVALVYSVLNGVDDIKDMPLVVQYVNSQEVREFNKLVNSKEIIAALNSYRFDFIYWDSHFTTRAGLLSLIPEGKAIIRFKHQMIKSHKRILRNEHLFGHNNIPIVNAPKEIINEVLLELAHSSTFAVGYHDVQRKRVYTIRTIRDDIDVGEMARSKGGTGHKNLAWYSEKI